MDHQARFIEHLHRQQARLLEQIELLSTGKARHQELKDGAWVDATESLLVTLYRDLGEIGALIQEATAPPDL